MSCFKKCLLLAIGASVFTAIAVRALLAMLKIAAIGVMPASAFVALLAFIIAGVIVITCYNKCK